MKTESKTRTERRRQLRAILDTAQALADGKDPADFPEYGFRPRVEKLANIFREARSRKAESAKITTIPVLFQPPEEKPLKGTEYLSNILATAFYWHDHGVGPECLPPGLDPTTKRLMTLIMSPSSYRETVQEPDHDLPA